MFIREERDACREGQGTYNTRYGSERAPSRSSSIKAWITPSVLCRRRVWSPFPWRHAFDRSPCMCCGHALCFLLHAHLTPAPLSPSVCVVCGVLCFVCVCVCVCRNISKQAFLETLQDNLIEMDVLASAQREAAYNHGYVAWLLLPLLPLLLFLLFPLLLLLLLHPSLHDASHLPLPHAFISLACPQMSRVQTFSTAKIRFLPECSGLIYLHSVHP